ncbi:MAG: hypothetical protein IJU54_00835 [Alphaproteobacteria bacterium]|nr:hypothetical protein [Alphaproteobacteria bacterium]
MILNEHMNGILKSQVLYIIQICALCCNICTSSTSLNTNNNSSCIKDCIQEHASSNSISSLKGIYVDYFNKNIDQYCTFATTNCTSALSHAELFVYNLYKYIVMANHI